MSRRTFRHAGASQGDIENLTRARSAAVVPSSSAAQKAVAHKRTLQQRLQEAKAVQGKRALTPEGREGKITGLDYKSAAVFVTFNGAIEKKMNLETLQVLDD